MKILNDHTIKSLTHPPFFADKLCCLGRFDEAIGVFGAKKLGDVGCWSTILSGVISRKTGTELPA